jgi:hypothetical protein
LVEGADEHKIYNSAGISAMDGFDLPNRLSWEGARGGEGCEASHGRAFEVGAQGLEAVGESVYERRGGLRRQLG